MDVKIVQLEQRMEAVEKRFDKLEANLQRIWERIDQHREGQIETKTMVENIVRELTQLRIEVAALADAQGSKWEMFWSKSAWFAGGLLVAIVLTQLGLK